MKNSVGTQSAYLSPFRWAGSKKKIIGILEAFWRPEFSRYVEPFCGSASLFFRLRPERATLSDVNFDLIHALRRIRQQPLEICRLVSGLSQDDKTYYEVRATSPQELGESDRAARFVYLNRLCFNGLYRTNIKGEFNVPYGGKRSGALPSPADFERFSKDLRRAELQCCDFEVTLSSVKRGEFVYLDPPYHLSEVRTFRQYDSAAFDFGAVWRLRQCLESLYERGVSFLLSYADSAEGRFLARGFRTGRVEVSRNIAGFASNRRRYTELLVYPPYMKCAMPGRSHG